MAWYKTGTVSVTNGATAVTATGTKFATNARVGDGFRGPDGEWYEVTNIASETTIGIYPAYQGVTVSGSTNYMIAPLQGYNKESADRLRAITDSINDISDDVAAADASAAAALASQNAAKTSETNAKTSETNSGTNAAAALASKVAAAESATAAAGSATAASSSATAANVSKVAAGVSEINAATSASNAAAAASSGLDKMPDNWIANPQFLATGTLITIDNAGQSTTYVDRNASGVPAGFSSMRVGRNLKKTSNTLGAVALPLVNNYSYIPVVPNQSIDVSIEMACTGNLTTGSATARVVLVEFDIAGTFIANTRLLAYDNVVGGLQTLQGTLTTGPNTYRVTVGVWNESAMPVDGTIYFGSPAVTKRQASVSILQQNKMNAANPRFTGALSGPNTTEPLPILTSGYTTGLGAYNSGALSGNPSNAFVSQGFSFSTANLGPQFIGARSYGVQGAHGAVLSGRSCVTLMGLASDGTNYQPIARMDAYTEENTTPTASGGEWQVWTTPNGANRPVLAARFRQNGDFSAVGAISGLSATVTSAFVKTGSSSVGMNINRTGSALNSFYGAQTTGGQMYFGTGDGTNFVVNDAASPTGAWLTLNGTLASFKGSVAVASDINVTGTVVALGKIDARASIDEATTQTMASAASLNLTAATSNTISVTGTTTITSLGSGTAGVRRLLKFAAALTLTHNATSLILPGGASIVTATNDVAEVMCLGGSNWVCYAYNRASGQPLRTVAQTLGGTGRTDGRALFSEVGVNQPAALYSTQGLYMGWNTTTQGEGHFIVNRGGGAGGFNWRSVNADNSATGPTMSYSYDGVLTVPSMPKVNGVPIVEAGSSANGTFTKFEDGTLICRYKYAVIRTMSTASGALFFGGVGEGAKNFPATFIAAPVISIQGALETGEGWFMPGSTLLNSTTQWPSGYVFTQISRGAMIISMDYLAVGRWK
jgi:hypothetical protein